MVTVWSAATEAVAARTVVHAMANSPTRQSRLERKVRAVDFFMDGAVCIRRAFQSANMPAVTSGRDDPHMALTKRLRD
jgi:hypothetical protein